MTTICVQCKHHKWSGQEQWYDHLCGAPDVAAVKKQDPVTGKTRFARGDASLCFVDDPRPYCRDINKGNCPHFERV